MPKQLKIPNVRFNLKSHKSKTEPILIIAVFRYSRGRLVYSTKEKVIPKYWNRRARLANNVKNHPEYLAMNDRLNDLAKLIRAVHENYNFGEISVQDFKRELDLRLGRVELTQTEEKRMSFFEFIEEYLKERIESPQAKRGTWKILKTCFNHLKAYSKEIGKELDFDNIDFHFREDFKNWCFNKKNHSINYVAKMFQVISQFLHEAVARGHTQTKVHESPKWHIRKVKTKKFALTFDELDILARVDLNNNKRLDKVRDLFLIGAYSGLRFSDFTRIKPSHVIKEDEVEMLEIRTQKTGEIVTIPLIQKLKEILVKYSYSPPSISNVNMNKYLKEVAELAGLTNKILKTDTAGGKESEISTRVCDLISSHWARRSFATNFYRLGIPAFHLMKITGHTTEKQFFKYICIDGRENAKELAKEISIRLNGSRLQVV